jgi:hypothetical protein
MPAHEVFNPVLFNEIEPESLDLLPVSLAPFAFVKGRL